MEGIPDRTRNPEFQSRSSSRVLFPCRDSVFEVLRGFLPGALGSFLGNPLKALSRPKGGRMAWGYGALRLRSPNDRKGRKATVSKDSGTGSESMAAGKARREL
ncbi:hypothetical protein KPP03845_300025 (plasmid) [Streptomyces xanthophaeus]|nr:hypothetical protein KPP03845_300025 [Streptomyces xanthophaeus]